MKTVGTDPSGRWIPVADVNLPGPFWAISDTPEVPFQGVMDLPSSSGGKKKNPFGFLPSLTFVHGAVCAAVSEEKI